MPEDTTYADVIGAGCAPDPVSVTPPALGPTGLNGAPPDSDPLTPAGAAPPTGPGNGATTSAAAAAAAPAGSTAKSAVSTRVTGSTTVGSTRGARVHPDPGSAPTRAAAHAHNGTSTSRSLEAYPPPNASEKPDTSTDTCGSSAPTNGSRPACDTVKASPSPPSRCATSRPAASTRHTCPTRGADRAANDTTVPGAFTSRPTSPGTTDPAPASGHTTGRGTYAGIDPTPGTATGPTTVPWTGGSDTGPAPAASPDIPADGDAATAGDP
ncbi:hypothetical protein [Nostocoides sp. Soil756]|uniref:hypothetical protein n=1 Tax=Nostocoides sp. Soil756 TaxID=1736399 RepID=UPI0006F88FEF|nr:hypothetical protein [Tetrasphaera sp. Soil756]KRE60040.1 hypothetical protein ASG78_15045 [Tetrasphaera sp. Soil756]